MLCQRTNQFAASFEESNILLLQNISNPTQFYANTMEFKIVLKGVLDSGGKRSK